MQTIKNEIVDRVMTEHNLDGCSVSRGYSVIEKLVTGEDVEVTITFRKVDDDHYEITDRREFTLDGCRYKTINEIKHINKWHR
ncbi:TPA: hypothetical protein ACUNCG_000535 [Aeromonas hydrophila]